MTLTKTQYIVALQCPKNVWLSVNRKDIHPEQKDNSYINIGNIIGEEAKKYFSGGLEIHSASLDIIQASKDTQSAITNGAKIIYEATAINPDNDTNARIDILQLDEINKCWNLIEVKSSSNIKDYQLDDIAFQYYVFNAAGYNIGECFIMAPNKEYQLDGMHAIKDFFQLHNLTEEIIERQDCVINNIAKFIDQIKSKKEININIGAKCYKPFECGYIKHCWNDIPEYSIFNVFTKPKAEKIFRDYGPKISDLPKDLWPAGDKYNELNAHLDKKIKFDKDNIINFLKELKYPLFFLDYETISPPIPIVQGTSPYQQIPFQYSLHKLDKNKEIQHKEFLHVRNNDPREYFIKSLINDCEKDGSIIVYNKTFEESINKQLIADLPKYTNDLAKINERMVDLLVPFKKRYLYNPKQMGSASIKSVLPAFTEMSYEGMEISNGGDASNIYLKYFIEGFNSDFNQKYKNALKKYCKLDTLSMVKLLDVLWDYAK